MDVHPSATGIWSDALAMVTIYSSRQGIAIRDRTTKICQMTKLLLVILISASPRDKASTVIIITLTARGRLSLPSSDKLEGFIVANCSRNMSPPASAAKGAFSPAYKSPCSEADIFRRIDANRLITDTLSKMRRVRRLHIRFKIRGGYVGILCRSSMVS